MLAGPRVTCAQSKQAVELVMRAERAFKKNQYASAIKLCQQAIKLSPRYVRAHSWQGASHRRLFLVLRRDSKQKTAAERHRQAAINSFRQVMLLSPRSADATVAKAGIDELTRLAPFLTYLSNSKLVVDGKSVKLSTPLALSASGRMLVSLRDFAQVFECNVTYKADDRSILLENGEKKVWLKVNYYQATIDGNETELQQPPVVFEGKTFVPADLCELAFKASHRWHYATKTLSIRTDGTIEEEKEETF